MDAAPPSQETAAGGQLNMKNANPSRTNVRYLCELALLMAIVIIMAFTPLGYLKTPFAEITFIVVPVAIGAVTLGPGAGAFLGLVFGLTSFAQCFGMSAFGTMLLSMKPVATFVACVVPRIFVGLLPGLAYRGLRKVDKKDGWSIAVCCVLAPITNTVLYLLATCLFFQDILMEAYGYVGSGGIVFLGWLIASVAVNIVCETASSLILGGAISKALKKTLNRV